MQPDQALRRRRVLLALARRELGEADLATRPEHVVLHDQAVDRLPGGIWQRVVGGAHVGKLGLAVAERRGRRQRDSMQHAEDDRHRHVRGVGVPQPIAEAVEPAPVVQATDVVVFVQVGDVADLRDGEPAPAGTRGGAADLQRAEPRRKVPQLRIAEALVAADHHGVAINGGPDCSHSRGIDRFGEIYATDLGDERRMQRTHLDAHARPPGRVEGAA